MSMETYVIGFVKPDDTFMKMKRIWDNCKELDVEIPLKVSNFFNECEPDENGLNVEIPTHDWDNGDMESGKEVYLHEIPEKVNVIRFYNSW